MKRRYFLGLALAGIVLANPANAAGFPSRPIEFVVPLAAGGPVDVVTRKIAERFKVDLGQPGVVLNKPGANGVVAWQSLLGTPADGYSVMAAAGQGLGFVHLMNSQLKTTFMHDFKPVAAYANYPVVFLVNAALPVHSLKELAAYARQHPNAVGYGTTGVGSGGHFLFELYKSETGLTDTELPPVHFAGVAPEITDLVGGHIKAAIMPLTSQATDQIKTGKVRALAVSSDRRSPFAPDIPTVVEQGYPDLVARDYLTYWVVAGTPDAVVATLSDAVRKAVQDPGVKKILGDLYLEAEYQDGAGAKAQFEQRAKQFSPLVEKLQLKLQ